MRFLLLFLCSLTMVACGVDAMVGGPADGGGRANADSGDGAAGCPKPIDYCGDGGPGCSTPEPIPMTCMFFVDSYSWTECSDGYVIVTMVTEGNGAVSYYRNGKLVATFGGYLRVACLQGPADFVRPDCTPVRTVDLCARDASTEIN